MYRKRLTSLILAVATAALVAGLFTPQAMADGTASCDLLEIADPIVDDETVPEVIDDEVVVESAEALPQQDCAESADAIAYPGPFTNSPAAPSGPYSSPDLSAPAPAIETAPVIAAAPSEPTLAHSGSETFVLAYLGTGMLAFGAVALGIRRSSGTR